MNDILQGNSLDVLKTLPDQSVHCCVTSPPYYGLRDYGADGQLGLESTPEEYVSNMVDVFREVRRVLRDDGTLWLNLGDTYSGSGNGAAHYPDSVNGTKQSTNKGTVDKPNIPRGRIPDGLKPKDLVGIPWRVAFALQADGWYLRSDIIWHKPNPMPESVTDRPTKAHEYIFLLSNSERYYYDHEAIKEDAIYGGLREDKPRGSFQGKFEDMAFRAIREKRNKRTVWTVTTQPYSEAHFAVYPPKLIEPCILAGCPVGGTVLDPFFGSGTTGEVAIRHNRNFIGIELNPEYIKIARKRLAIVQPVLNF